MVAVYHVEKRNELLSRIELPTSSLPRKCSTAELQQLPNKRAGDEARTRDLQLGRLSLYQLSYSRKNYCFKELWAEKDSNLRSRKTADLQSALVGHLSICPKKEPLAGIEPATY